MVLGAFPNARAEYAAFGQKHLGAGSVRYTVDVSANRQPKQGLARVRYRVPCLISDVPCL
jgi:hypothetical protein